MYKKITDELGNVSLNIIGTNTWVPVDEFNTDYQEYLEWLAEGNEPEIIDLSE